MYFANKSMRTTRGRKYTGPKVEVKSNKKLGHALGYHLATTRWIARHPSVHGRSLPRIVLRGSLRVLAVGQERVTKLIQTSSSPIISVNF